MPRAAFSDAHTTAFSTLSTGSAAGGTVTTRLHMQSALHDPSALARVLLKHAAGADHGGGIFAWTTSAGIGRALKHASMIALYGRGSFSLIVGTDTITSSAAITELQALEGSNVGLRVQAFVHDTSPLFHPKLAWFEVGTQLVLINGSGNLTGSGLQTNWEFFTETNVAGADAAALRQQLKDWPVQHATELLKLDDPRVMARVAQNKLDERTILKSRRATAAAAVAAQKPTMHSGEFLVAELTYASGRRTQANVHKRHFEGFFKASVTAKTLHTFREVDSAGALGPARVAEAVSVGSNNHRFELPSGSPTSWQKPWPIAIFTRSDTDEIVYEVVLATSAGYGRLTQLLTTAAGPIKGNNRRQETFTRGDLSAAWPSAHILSATT